MSMKGVVDQKISMGFKSSQTDPIDETRAITIKPLMALPPPYWLIIPIGIVFVGLFYLATRK